MEVIQSVALLRSTLQQKKSGIGASLKAPVGFVPTMGYLHEGHLSLIKAAREASEIVVLSIFVNPLQFGPTEDLDRYPRDTERDLKLAEEAGVDIVFLPQVEEMYPGPVKTTVSVSGITSVLCGASRPVHFDGVTTVVAKLLNIVQPDKAFFGLKDAQQVAVVSQMVQDLNMNVDIVACPILREEDGLAMSSRNVFLSKDEREQALVLSRSLKAAEAWVREHASFRAEDLRGAVKAVIEEAPLADIDYVEVLTYPQLEQPEAVEAGVPVRLIVALAVKFGATRLIDNTILTLGK
ncbi:pantoate--beta-alanine ligase [Paenibacillus chitinolyticus]|uniref:Pantothenate synthetase n=1 Tax=Paenibacillus chitinolyticus TaxID=79263 RepID=A0A410WV67_9BACL|nr:pantoate--beta-alanine ligase [Paenibacillus chitinolyticus]MCY9589331.1 pantoate--beta-alanine ligase [Paenibacillus chitinolyticus]MCY9594404.1 pantoate--beta-alanine ligase [Paenibacillus chitinolyticus]QAV18346.1 pantoate--beta-alanine ligase [Paenibacillus chitinolyticus]